MYKEIGQKRMSATKNSSRGSRRSKDEEGPGGKGTEIDKGTVRVPETHGIIGVERERTASKSGKRRNGGTHNDQRSVN